MANMLSLPNLLVLLQDGQQDEMVQELCEKAESLRRRRRYKEAIEVAENALQLARDKFNPIARGVALLYLSVARVSSGLPGQVARAIRDCDAAIKCFSMDPHNRSIALVLRAQIELETHGEELGSKQYALGYLQRAAHTLGTDWRVHRPAGDNLLKIVNEKIAELVALLSRVESIPAMPKQSTRSPDVPESKDATVPISPIRDLDQPPIHLPVPTRLVWSGQDAIEMDFLPDHDRLTNTPDHNDPRLDYVEIQQCSINGKPYAVHPVYSGDGSDRLRLHQGYQYLAIQVDADQEQTLHSDQYVLVKRQAQPDQGGQRVVVSDPQHERVWVWIANEETGIIAPRILGEDESVLAERQTERQWTIAEDVYGAELHIIGVVEAILTPLIASHVSNKACAVDEELLACLDDLHAVEGLGSSIDQGLGAIQRKFQNYFKQKYGLEPITIDIGRTVFDPNLHEAVGSDHNPSLPSAVILKVVSDGYHHKGKLFRPARVIVNR